MVTLQLTAVRRIEHLREVKTLTKRQHQVLEFIRSRQELEGETPSLREIAQHFGFSSMNAAVAHVRALCKKGHLQSRPGRARALRVVSEQGQGMQRLLEVPILGSIPAGLAEERQQESLGVLRMDSRILGGATPDRLFALEVSGDSMVGKHIIDGDYVILDRGRAPKSGDVVSALLDGESTLKTLVIEEGRPVLRAENVRYPELIPLEELRIQGVMVGLVRGSASSS